MTPDAIIAAVQLVFTVALVPTLVDDRAQVPRGTSGVTAMGLWIIAAQYVSLHMTLATIAACAAATAWSMIFILRPVR